MTATARIVLYVTTYPGRTAWNIAKILKIPSANVSSALCRLAKKGTLGRVKNYDGAWVYYDPNSYTCDLRRFKVDVTKFETLSVKEMK